MKLVILTAPSGSGKTTIARRLMEAVPKLRFSVSATTRPPRSGEEDGVDYYFLTPEAFRARIEADKFLEYEEVYPSLFYGTPQSELERVPEGGALVLDVDVMGALNVKKQYDDEALAIFIRPPSLEVLKARLSQRGTESDDSLSGRLERAQTEITYADRFDVIVVNEHLEEAVGETVRHVQAFLRAAPADTL